MGVKIISLLCGCLLVATSVFAQKRQKKQRAGLSNESYIEKVGISFHDGSFLLGELLSDDNKEVKILAFGDDELTIEHGLIKSIRKESDGFSFTRNGRFNYDKGYFVNISPYGFGVSFDGNVSYAPHLIVGRHINKRWAVGLGVGIEMHNDQISDNWFDYTTIPTFAYGQYHFIVNGPRLYGYGKLGYANAVEVNNNGFLFNDEISTNLYSQLGIGIVFPSRWAGRFSLEYGRTYMGVNGTLNRRDFNNNTVIQEFTQLFARNTLKLGIAFKQ